MKRYILVMAAAILISLFFSNFIHAKTKSLTLTTLDVKEPYEVIDIVSYRTSTTDLNSLISGIKKAASSLGADAVVGLRLANYGDFFYAYGTAVKFKEKQ